jgi:hypothetical protein
MSATRTTSRSNASIVSYLCDQGPRRGHVRATHHGSGLWRVESVDDPTLGYWTRFTDEKNLVDEAQRLRSLLSTAITHEAHARRLRAEAAAYCREQTAGMIDEELDLELERHGGTP